MNGILPAGRPHPLTDEPTSDPFDRFALGASSENALSGVGVVGSSVKEKSHSQKKGREQDG